MIFLDNSLPRAPVNSDRSKNLYILSEKHSQQSHNESEVAQILFI